jgi:hypothetical protein
VVTAQLPPMAEGVVEVVHSGHSSVTGQTVVPTVTTSVVTHSPWCSAGQLVTVGAHEVTV